MHAKLPSEVILTLDGGMTGNLGPKLDFLGEDLNLNSSSELSAFGACGIGSMTTSTKPRLLLSIKFSRSSLEVLETESFNFVFCGKIEIVSWPLFFKMGLRVSS